MLINATVKAVQGEKRLQLIKEMNFPGNRKIIFEHIIKARKDNVNAAIAHELYTYQTYILRFVPDCNALTAEK